MAWTLLPCPSCLSPNQGDGEFDCDVCQGGYGIVIRSAQDEDWFKALVGPAAWARFVAHVRP